MSFKARPIVAGLRARIHTGKNMRAEESTARDLFDGRVHYEIPAYQRPYVWNEEDQWAPLWDDVVRVATAVVLQGSDPNTQVANHFLGAVVVEPKTDEANFSRNLVIDGQQRMTTLQLLLDAVQHVAVELGHFELAEDLEDLVLNKSPRYVDLPERFKLWPSNADREPFERAMDPKPGQSDTSHRMADAHQFFRDEAARWITGTPDEDGNTPAGSPEDRAAALSKVLQSKLIVIAINLAGSDDAQLIFETLNDRGTPLLKADLIKNWIFRRGTTVGADVDLWSTTHWADFDSDWWRKEIAQGRMSRSRVDIFLQYWLTMRLRDEVKVEHVFRTFTEYAEPFMATNESSESLLAELRADADVYRSFAQLSDETPEGRFYSRVIETMELAATTPVFLWLLSSNHDVPPSQIRIGLESLESWVIRRTLLGYTSKDVNKFMVVILGKLDGVQPQSVGDGIRDVLEQQVSPNRLWPRNSEVLEALPRRRLYGYIRQSRLEVVLGVVEQHLRDQSKMYEAVKLPEGLEIEHIMPKGWRSFWDSDPSLGPEAAARRDQLIHTLGNLTLITKSLNGSLSNRPWRDSDASELKEGGQAGKGKRTLLDAFSLLVLNKAVVTGHDQAWTEEDVRDRGAIISQAICKIWPAPDTEIEQLG
jgi:hypothetical protein